MMSINSSTSISLEDYAKKVAYKEELGLAKTLKSDSLDHASKINELEQTGNKTIILSKEQYEAIVNAVYKIPTLEIAKSFSINGMHGYYTSIEFGNDQNAIQYRIWSPGLRGKKRGNPNFSAACRLILETAGIKPRKVL